MIIKHLKAMICTTFHHPWKMQWESLLRDIIHRMSMIRKCTKMLPERSFSRTAWNHVIFHRSLFQILIGTSTTINWLNKNASQHATMPKFSYISVTLLLKEKIFIGTLLNQKPIINKLKTTIQIEECIQDMKRDWKRPE